MIQFNHNFTTMLIQNVFEFCHAMDSNAHKRFLRETFSGWQCDTEEFTNLWMWFFNSIIKTILVYYIHKSFVILEQCMHWKMQHVANCSYDWHDGFWKFWNFITLSLLIIRNYFEKETRCQVVLTESMMLWW